MCTSRRPHGFTLIELIVFIVIVSVALAGVLTVLNVTAKSSADPMIRKQALAIAEALLEEVMLQPFTWCDPNDDVELAAATSYAGCTRPENTLAPEADEPTTANGNNRGVGARPWDNVDDYHNLVTTTNIAGGGAALYAATVTIAQDSLNFIPADASLRITVTVTAGGEAIQLQGYRTRHSPNFGP
jgi:MSHA pilin protein MshD